MMFTKRQLQMLASEEFDELLANDEILNNLEHKTDDNPINSFLLLDALNLGNYKIGSLPVRPLTLAKWGFLALVKSPYVTGENLISDVDMNVFLYVLSRNTLHEINVSLSDIVMVSKDMIYATNLTINEIHSEIQEMLKIAFNPLKVLTAKESASNNVSYDASWIMTMALIVAKVTNEKLSFILHEMALSTVCSCYISHCLNINPQMQLNNIDTENSIAISKRVEELSIEFLKGK